MHAAVDARLGDLLHERLDRRPTPLHPWRGETGGAQRRQGPPTDLRVQHGRDGRREDAMGTGVLGVHRRVNQGYPSSLPLRGVIVIAVAIAYRGDGPPEVVVILR